MCLLAQAQTHGSSQEHPMSPDRQLCCLSPVHEQWLSTEPSWPPHERATNVATPFG